MSFIIDYDKISTTDNAYKGPWGTQCVALVQMATPASGNTNPPQTTQWHPGLWVHDAADGAIKKGTVIATFLKDVYPTTDPRHAAVYKSHDGSGITVMDQWVGKSAPSERTLAYRDLPQDLSTLGLKDVDNGRLYYVVELTTAPGQNGPSTPPAPASQ